MQAARPPTARRSVLLVLAAVVLPALVVSCAAVDSRRSDPTFAVVFGADGVAITDGNWVEKVPMGNPEVVPWSGEAVGLDESTAAVVAVHHIAVVTPHAPDVLADCAECAGIAATDDHIVTTRRNLTPGGGFDIVFFSHDLQEERSVAAQRLEERGTTSFSAENVESPTTLAADADRVTVGYLSRVGGVRAGPSIIAQYDHDGRLLGSVQVDGIIGGGPAVSPDGRLLAVGIGGSGGACVTVLEPALVDLQTLRVQLIEPTRPAAVAVDSSTSDAWFLLTDLIWRESTLLVTGEVHAPPAGEGCDPQPESWQRSYDPATGQVDDLGDLAARALRWVGPDCDHLLAVIGPWESAALVRTTAGPEQQLGRFARIGLGQPVPASCRPAP